MLVYCIQYMCLSHHLIVMVTNTEENLFSEVIIRNAIFSFVMLFCGLIKNNCTAHTPIGMHYLI